MHLIEVFLIAMIYICTVYGFFSSLAPGHLATHLILALIINRRNYLDARTAFTLLCIGIKIQDINSILQRVVIY